MTTSLLELGIDGRTIGRADFHADRKRGIGGSDAGAVMGMSPWKTPLEVWLEKTGRSKSDDISSNKSVRWGNRLEPLIVADFSDETGLAVIRDESTFRHPEHPFILGHVDGLIAREKSGFEAKTVGSHADKSEWGEQGTDQVPIHYLLQCQHYMAVTNYSKWYLAALFVADLDLKTYVIERDDELIQMMIETYIPFWQSVIDQVQPYFDPTAPASLKIVKKLYPGTNGQTIELPDESLEWHEKLVAAKQQERDAKAVTELAKANLLALMGESAVGRLPTGEGGYTRKIATRAEHSVAASSYLDFRYSKKA